MLPFSAVDPHDFIHMDSHVFEIQVERDKNLEAISQSLTGVIQEYVARYAQAGAKFVIVPQTRKLTIQPQTHKNVVGVSASQKAG